MYTIQIIKCTLDKCYCVYYINCRVYTITISNCTLYTLQNVHHTCTLYSSCRYPDYTSPGTQGTHILPTWSKHTYNALPCTALNLTALFCTSLYCTALVCTELHWYAHRGTAQQSCKKRVLRVLQNLIFLIFSAKFVQYSTKFLSLNMQIWNNFKNTIFTACKGCKLCKY